MLRQRAAKQRAEKMPPRISTNMMHDNNRDSWLLGFPGDGWINDMLGFFAAFAIDV
jgi:hypothetical protein